MLEEKVGQQETEKTKTCNDLDRNARHHRLWVLLLQLGSCSVFTSADLSLS